MRLKLLMPIAALALVPQQVLAAGEPPAACIYLATKRVPREMMVALVKNGFKTTTAKEKEAMAMIGEQVGGCRSHNGWGQKRQDAAVRYLTGRVLREDSIFQGKAMGVTAEMLDGIVAKLDATARSSYVSGSVTTQTNEAVVAQVQAAGIKVDAMAPAAQQTLMSVVSEGVAGTVITQDSIGQFNH